MKPSFHSLVLEVFHIWINFLHLVSKAKAHKIGLSYFQQTTDWFIRLRQQIKSLAVFKVCYSFWWNKFWNKSEGKQGGLGFRAQRPLSSHLYYSWPVTFPFILFLLSLFWVRNSCVCLLFDSLFRFSKVFVLKYSVSRLYFISRTWLEFLNNQLCPIKPKELLEVFVRI